MTDQDLESCLDGDTLRVHALVEAYKKLRAENAELTEALQHPSYEVENRLRAERDAVKARLRHHIRMYRVDDQEPVFLWHRPADPDEEEVFDVTEHNLSCPDCQPLYAAPTPPSVPSAKQLSDHKSAAYVLGWNECRAAMIAAAPKPGEWG